MKAIPDFSFECANGFECIAGLDEAGRGPLCGPVVAAAVIFKTQFVPKDIKITDSKQMTKSARKIAFEWIIQNTVWAVGMCSPSEIDEINILWASMRAMQRAVDNLPCVPRFCLVDGNRLPPEMNGLAIIRGDSLSISIAAASIVAKEFRDNIMLKLSLEFPEYGWEKNSGYPTPGHLAAIKKHGINDNYRKTYAPVKKLL